MGGSVLAGERAWRYSWLFFMHTTVHALCIMRHLFPPDGIQSMGGIMKFD